MKKQTLIICIIGILLLLQPLNAQTWTATKRLTWNSGYSWPPAVTVDSNNYIHVIWDDGTPGNTEIYYKRSTDGGDTWGSKRLTWNSGSSKNPAIAVDSDNHIHVVWEDNTPGNLEIYYKRSTNGGSTWFTKRLTYNSGGSTESAIAVDSSNTIHVVWKDETPGNFEIYYKKSTNGGLTWDGTKRLTWTTWGSNLPVIAVDSSNKIHVVWADLTVIYYMRSNDGGLNWTTKRLSWGSGYSYSPSISVDSSDNIHVVWNDDTSGNNEIYFKKSTDGGVTWIGSKRLTWNSGLSIDAAIAVDSSNNVHVVWQDYSSVNYEIYYRRSTNGGITWDGVRRLTWNSGTSHTPAIAADSNINIHVVWADTTVGNGEIYYRKGIQ